MARLFNLSDLLGTAGQAEIDFSVNLRGLVEWYPRAIDSLLKITYFIGDLAEPESDRGAFEFFAFTHYQQAPYTFLAIYDLTRRGFYLEATILFRSLLEVFVQLRYFDLHPDELMKSVKQNSRVRFEKMFNELSPEFYGKHYRYYSTWFAHGRGGHLAFRYKSDGDGKTALLGNEYNEDSVAFLSNGFIPLMLGFLKFYSLFFPANRLASEAAFSEELSKVERWLEGHVEAHKSINPRSKEEWYASYEPLWRPSGVGV